MKQSDIWSLGVLLLVICEPEKMDELERKVRSEIKLKLACPYRGHSHQLMEFIKLCFKPEDERPSAVELKSSDFIKKAVSKKELASFVRSLSAT